MQRILDSSASVFHWWRQRGFCQTGSMPNFGLAWGTKNMLTCIQTCSKFYSQFVNVMMGACKRLLTVLNTTSVSHLDPQFTGVCRLLIKINTENNHICIRGFDNDPVLLSQFLSLLSAWKAWRIIRVSASSWVLCKSGLTVIVTITGRFICSVNIYCDNNGEIYM
jgi:hypothetical protein